MCFGRLHILSKTSRIGSHAVNRGAFCGSFLLGIRILAVRSGNRRNVCYNRKMKFHMNWYAFIFPNAGLTITIINIGNMLACPAILWVVTVATVLLTAAWIIVVIFHVRALYKGCCLVIL
jgi:tellurite resistance protein TehA-like permease